MPGVSSSLWLRACLLGLAAAPLTVAGVHAQALQVTPILVEIVGGQLATTLAITNTGGTTSAIQVRAFTWKQDGLSDTLTPTEDVVISPPITDVGPGEMQTFRLVVRSNVAPAYRLLVDELPAATARTAVRFAIRLSIPVFLEPDGRAPPKLAWRIVVADGAASLLVRNDGDGWTRLLTPELSLPGARAGLRVVANTNPYILPHSERAWRIEGGAALRPGMSARLTGLFDAQRLDAAVPVTTN